MHLMVLHSVPTVLCQRDSSNNLEMPFLAPYRCHDHNHAYPSTNKPASKTNASLTHTALVTLPFCNKKHNHNLPLLRPATAQLAVRGPPSQKLLVSTGRSISVSVAVSEKAQARVEVGMKAEAKAKAKINSYT
jgi:hypothetical protein